MRIEVLKVRKKWLALGAGLLLAGLAAIFGPGVDVETIETLEGPIAGYGEMQLDALGDKDHDDIK